MMGRAPPIARVVLLLPQRGARPVDYPNRFFRMLFGTSLAHREAVYKRAGSSAVHEIARAWD